MDSFMPLDEAPATVRGAAAGRAPFTEVQH